MDRIENCIENEESRRILVEPLFNAEANDDGTADWILIFTISSAICKELGYEPISLQVIENINTYAQTNKNDPDYTNFDEHFALPILKYLKTKYQS